MNLLNEIMKLQGKIRISLIRAGLDEEESLDAACEIVDMVLNSDVADQAHRDAYEELPEASK